MIHTEQHRFTVFCGSGFAVDGVVRVRQLRAGRGDVHMVVEQREPVAVLVSRAGSENLVAFPRTTQPRMLVALIALPIAARLAVRLLSHRR